MEVMNIKVSTETMDDIVVVYVEGEVDVYTSTYFKRELINALENSGLNKLIISLNDVKYIDSTGLGILIGMLKRVKERNGKMTVVCSNPQIKKVFSITGLIKILGMHDNLQSAIDSLKKDIS